MAFFEVLFAGVWAVTAVVLVLAIGLRIDARRMRSAALRQAEDRRRRELARSSRCGCGGQDPDIYYPAGHPCRKTGVGTRE